MPLDPRIHFALSNLTQSTPFIRLYTAKTIEEELQRAGELFLKQQMDINLSKKEVRIFLEISISQKKLFSFSQNFTSIDIL